MIEPVMLTPFQKATHEARIDLDHIKETLHQKKLWMKCGLALNEDPKTLQRHFSNLSLTYLELKTIEKVIIASAEEETEW